jgi:hypothetical protein
MEPAMLTRQPDDPGVKLPPAAPSPTLGDVMAKIVDLFSMMQLLALMNAAMIGGLAAFLAFYRANVAGCWLLCALAFALPFAAVAQI